MAYSFETTEVDGMFVVRVAGERPYFDSDNFDEMWNFWSGLADKLRGGGARRILSVNSARGRLSSSAVLAFYNRLGELGFEPGTRMAVTVPADVDIDRVRPVIQLGVSVAAIAGWDIKLFGSERDAVDWLQRV